MLLLRDYIAQALSLIVMEINLFNFYLSSSSFTDIPWVSLTAIWSFI